MQTVEKQNPWLTKQKGLSAHGQMCFCQIPTVSHHDPELTFNHSFIEPPSSGWVTEGSSFDSDEEEGEALYCVPPREGKKGNSVRL